jgi:hypothetical protein
MDKHVEFLVEDVRVIRSDVASMKEVLVQNTETLKHYNRSLDLHIKRTELLEEAMKTALLPIKAAIFVSKVVIGTAATYGALKVLGFF